MRLRRTIAAIAVVAAGTGIAVAATAPPTAATDTTGPGYSPFSVPETAVLLSETFQGARLHDDFVLLGHAGLTNAPEGSGDEPKLGRDLKDYDSDGKYEQSSARLGAPPYSPDAKANPGYLQLTDHNHDKVGGVLYNNPLPTSGGLNVTFEMYQYNSTTPANPADGIGFFISDGAYELVAPGAYGGSLGYAQKVAGQGAGGAVPSPNVSSGGVYHGYLGIGFDVLGNFAANSEGRGYKPGYTAEGWGDRRPNTVTLRGPMGANTLEGYQRLTIASLAGKGSLGYNDASAATQESPKDAKRLVRITLTPEEYPTVTVFVAFDGKQSTLDNETVSQVLKYRMTEKMPETFKFGFAGSTGDMTDVHLIRTLDVSTLRPVTPKILLDKEAIVVPAGGSCTAGQEGLATADPSTAPYAENDEVCYRFKVTNVGDIELTNVRITDPLLAGVTDPESIAVLSAHDGDDGGTDTAYFYATYKVTAGDVERKSVVNTATATGEAGSLSVTDEDSETVPTRPSAGIHLEKTVAITGDGLCDPGLAFADSVAVPGTTASVCYRFHVTNTGNTPLAITLTDDVIGFTVTADASRPYLQPGETMDFYHPHTIADADTTFVNTATVVGTHEGGTVDSTDDADVTFAVSIPLPQVGGTRDVVGVAALSVSAALTVYLLDIRRRRRGTHAL